MHALSRALFVLLGWSVLRAQAADTTGRPPLFAPEFVPGGQERTAPSVTPAKRAATPVTERLRAIINDAARQVLETAPPAEPGGSSAGAVTLAPGGALMMAPVVVRDVPLRENQISSPPLRLYHFTPAPPDKHRRIAGGATAPLYHTFFGGKEFQIDLSLFNLAGNGIDHNIDFSRVELSFTIKW